MGMLGSTHVFEKLVGVRVVKGAGDANKGDVETRLVLDRERDQVLLSIDDICDFDKRPNPISASL